MTFEEFFIKKKIDLVQLRRAMPDLYAEFHEHYLKMGAKSFDHTKKYWFNRLRKDYLLPDREELPVDTKPVDQAPSAKAEKAVPKTAAAKPVGFKPRFKAGGTTPVAKTAEPKQETAETPPTEDTPTPPASSQPTKPIGFKPRFKPGITKPKKD